MILPINIGVCKVCQYGMLEIIFNFQKQKCSIMCDECLAEWETPDNALQNVKGFRKSYEKFEARTATLEEVQQAGWENFISQ